MATFYICKHCGNLIELVHDAGVPVVCCGEKMHKLTANTTDAATEKHVPLVKVDGGTVSVNVGSVSHPMEEKHWIVWVALETRNGIHRKNLKPGSAPEVTFALGGDQPVAVYAYCNLHGLWKSEL